jgi:uncharacterized protein YpmB
MKKKLPIIIIGIIVVFVILVVVSMVLEEIDMYEYEKAEKEALSKISVKVPKKFERSSYSSTIYYHLYDEETRCSFIVDVEADSYNYEDGMEYLEKRTTISLKDKVSEIQGIDLNNYKWYYLSVENEDGITYHYATVKDNTVYTLDYEIEDYSKGENPSNYCANIKDEIISTVKLK